MSCCRRVYKVIKRETDFAFSSSLDLSIVLRQLSKRRRMSCNGPRISMFAKYLSDLMLCAYFLNYSSCGEGCQLPPKTYGN